ncbi:MAG: amino acid permease [Candidatus Omnitrophica bacterium]|nr:amino acid permease [Candidatus Omnitrophota bacterium]
MSPGPARLKRSLGLFALVAYGVGDILGAGIYVLIGKMAGLVGNACWLSFLIALVVASLTGLSYAELSSRFPRSAGESYYSLKAFGRPLLSYLVGFLVLISGVVSMAVVSQGFTGYVTALCPFLPGPGVILCFFLVLTVINFWGMRESSVTNIFCTALEISGILIVIAAGIGAFGRVNYLEISPPAGMKVSTALSQGAVFAFYAFIGFEDMVKAAEESREPEKLIPRAIVWSIAIVACLYVLTALAAVSVVPAGELAKSQAPLALVVKTGFPGIPPALFTLIALFAVTNTALVNFVMGSRLLYGMAREGLAPEAFAHIHPKRNTPDRAIIALLAVALPLALAGSLATLAQSNSLILLTVFFLVNVSLTVIKLRPAEAIPPFQIPVVIPILGALTCLFLIFYIQAEAFVIALSLVALALCLYLFAPSHRKNKARQNGA